MDEPKLYIENPNHKIERVFLPDDIYEQAMRAFIIVCADTVIIDRKSKKFFLVTRRAKPMAGPWIIGGRQMAGEIPEQAIRRCFKRETGLDVPENRFHFVLINNYIWKDREQEPQNVGSHNFALTFYIELSEEERTAVKLVSAEYEEFGLREFSREDLIREGAHQALIDLYDNVFIS